MIVVIFEVIPNEGRAHEYFDLAQELAPELDKIDGFISVERFESLADKGKYLSLSTWRDEAAAEAWYRHAGHRKAQAKGKERIFKDFRIRVAAVLRDYDLASRRIKPVPTDAETPAAQ
ncbi:MAG TPA: antibiotic biosynthesis monooxygenase [Alphaproteobacteria bacterium]|nr:antibiotic biosynthesis monooxygenase [Alphaproteobacteria bacterium]